MSCSKCELAQQVVPFQGTERELDPSKKSDHALIEVALQPRQQAFVRVGNANVMLSGCQQHLEEFMGKPLVFIRNSDGLI